MEMLFIPLFKGCDIIVKGEYTPGENRERDYPGKPAMFQIDAIESEQKNIYELLDWVSSTPNYLEIIEEKCIESIETN